LLIEKEDYVNFELIFRINLKRFLEDKIYAGGNFDEKH